MITDEQKLSELHKFKDDILDAVQRVIDQQDHRNKRGWETYEEKQEKLLRNLLPDLKTACTPKTDWVYVIVANLLNGIFVGLSIYIASRLIG